MKKIALFSGLIFILCTACDNKNSFNKELLIGDWKLQQSSVYPVYSPSISFNVNGEYEMVEFIKYPFNPAIINSGTITGKYLTYDNKIEFITAVIEIEAVTTDSNPITYTGSSTINFYNNWNNDSVQLYSNSRKPLSISEYNPIIWTIIELDENILKATKSPIDTLVYFKN